MGVVINCKNNTITCEVADAKIVFWVFENLKATYGGEGVENRLGGVENCFYERVQTMGYDTFYDTLQDDEGVEISREAMEIEDQLD